MKSDLETKPITYSKQKLWKRLFNICLLIEVNHITSQPSLPKKIKSCPWSVLGSVPKMGTWDLLAEYLPYESWNYYTPAGSSPMCLHRVSGFLLLPVFSSSCLRNRSDFLYSQLQEEMIYLAISSPPPHPKQTNTLPASYSALEEGLFFSLLTSWLNKTSFLFAFWTGQENSKNLGRECFLSVETDWSNCLIFFISSCPEWETTSIIFYLKTA